MNRSIVPRRPRRAVLKAVGALPLLARVPQASAQAGYPSRPIKLVVPLGTGSGSDIVGRQLAARLAEVFTQGVFVENRPGANAIIGHDYARSAAPDGYTLLISSTAPLLVIPAISASARHRLSDFVAVAPIARSPFLLLVSGQPGAPGSVKELNDRVRAQPASFASSGAGAMTHLVSELYLQRAGLKATHVPYKGSGQALSDLAGNHVLFASDSPTAALPMIRSGRLKAVAVSTSRRLASLPDVPTFAESGLGDTDVSIVSGVFAPAGTPRDIVERLNAEITRVVEGAELRGRLAAQELEPLALDAGRFQALMDAEAPFWQQFARQLGVRID